MKFGEKTYNISYLYIQPTTDQKYIFLIPENSKE